MRYRLYALALVALGLLADAVFSSAHARNRTDPQVTASAVASCLRLSASSSYANVRLSTYSRLPYVCRQVNLDPAGQ